MPRSRGALSGILLIALGVWGALIPFIGPAISFAFTPDDSWHWTSGRGWLEVLPGVVTAVGGVLLLLSANRITASIGSWLAVAGGAWFIVGTQLAPVLHLGSPGSPTGSSKGLRALESLAYFDGLGAVILFLGAASMGRLSVRSVRDVKAAQRRKADADAEAARLADERRRVDEQREEEQRRQDEQRREEGRLAEQRRQAEERRLAQERRQAQPGAQPEYGSQQSGAQQYGTQQHPPQSGAHVAPETQGPTPPDPNRRP